MSKRPWIEESEFNPGYLKRSVHLLPKQGDHEPWEFNGDYYEERELLPAVDLDDGSLQFSGRNEVRKAG